MPDLPTQEDPRLSPVVANDRVCTGVTTVGGRIFVSFPGADGPGVQVAEALPDGRRVPWPDASWNAVRDDHFPEGAYVHVNGLRTGPDGQLWIVDSGAPGLGQPQVPGGARLIVVAPGSGEVTRILDLGEAVRETSYVDDVRFNGGTAYLTDAGAAGLIVLDLATGRARRVLDGHPSTVGRPLVADGQVLCGPDGAEVVLHVDQLEVSPDGRYLYYQPASGGLSRIETRWLDDPTVASDTVAEHIERWLETPTTGGTAIDAAGTIYLSDAERRRVRTISPQGEVATLVADPRLIWVDAMWIDAGGDLWLPAAQLHRTPGLSGGAQRVDYPVWIYRMHIGVGPAPNDHA
ncbi:L-dopachrome tautomerase-related protein [Micromonospora sp. WMMD812]|uniref:SMP-30/gluconolactonase/LRE family protein n=1 Tax=Micromonospora sp. WMMD812 TaxID=3015152 RepID=UPI00248BEF03|nr:L-dopachrome tautomerase-related protein [Micromonospora sp. WMMD812]WBB66865.1 L-dopachrome tautomerase-related protein [Micromonospora sp. WMMD812]